VFCQCGCESAFHRVWEDSADRCLTLRRFKDLLKACIRTLEDIGVTLDRKTTICLALQHYRDEHDANGALEAAILTGVHRAVASASRDRTAVLSD